MLKSALLLVLAGICLPSVGSAQNNVDLVPGVPAPVTAMVAVVDMSGPSPSAVVVHASEVKSNAHAGGNFARAQVFAGGKSGVEVEGAHAVTTLLADKSKVFVQLPAVDPDTMRARVHLLRLKSSKDGREVFTFTQNAFGGSRKRHMDEVAITKTDVGSGEWISVTPEKPLVAGEYAIVFLPKDEMFFPETVYDFTIAPAAK